MISNLTFKLSHDVRRQLINGDELPTNLFKYAKHCQRVHQELKDLARVEAESLKKCVVVVATLVQKVSTNTIRTAKSSHQPVISGKDQLMKERKCFSCRKVGHKTMDCLSKNKLTNEQKPMSELAVSCMVVQESKPKESRTTVLQTIAPRAEELHVDKKPLIVSSFSLPGDFFAEEALVALCMLGNNGKIETTALFDTGATGYSFVDPVIAQRICDDLLIKPIRLSKPKTICGFNGKQASSVTHATYSIMTVQDHRETTTPMLITKLGQH